MSYPGTLSLPTLLMMILLVALGTAYYAFRLGKNPGLWFFLGILLGAIAPMILFTLSFYENPEKEENDPTMTASQHDQSLSAKSLEEIDPVIIQEESKLWYYVGEGGKQIGPVSILGLAELWNTGRIDLNSYVWAKGMTDWSQIGKLTDLVSLLRKKTVSKDIPG